MKLHLVILLIATSLLMNACSNGQNNSNSNSKGNEQTKTINYVLSAIDFQKKMEELSLAPVVDVRTPNEFSGGHIAKAINIDFRGSNFDSEISKLDKTKPVFVYCLSGGRSTAAANNMRSSGFTDVYELSGGMMKWRAASLPETTDSRTTSTGMTKAEYNKLLDSKKLVLIDFYAEWCAPCKKMAPYLEELKKEMADKVTIIRIDADKNTAMCKELKVEALPTLLLYKNKENTWSNTGYISKEDLLTHLK
jgi:thioredoxin